MNSKAAIVMQTDFTKDISVCTMQGVCMMVDPTLRVFDNTHDIKSFDTYQASTCLSYVVDFWPAGTVFVSVVDPGVGTDRRACVAKLKNGSYVVTPDNGTLTHVAKYIGVEAVRVINEEAHQLKNTAQCNIFHGRDLFAYCAAKLAAGIITYEEVGEEYPIEEIVLHEIIPYQWEGNKFFGMIDTADYHFGLICSNIPADVFEKAGVSYGDLLDVKIRKQGQEEPVFSGKVPFCDSFGSVAEGEPLLMVSETLQIQIAINYENMSEKYGIQVGPNWTIEMELCERGGK